MGEFHPGVGLLASRLKLPVIPIRVEGTGRVLPRGRTLPRFARTRVSFGDALYLSNEKPEIATKVVAEAVKGL